MGHWGEPAGLGALGNSPAGGHGRSSGGFTHPPLLFAQGETREAFSLMMESPNSRNEIRNREKWQSGDNTGWSQCFLVLLYCHF